MTTYSQRYQDTQYIKKAFYSDPTSASTGLIMPRDENYSKYLTPGHDILKQNASRTHQRQLINECDDVINQSTLAFQRLGAPQRATGNLVSPTRLTSDRTTVPPSQRGFTIAGTSAQGAEREASQRLKSAAIQNATFRAQIKQVRKDMEGAMAQWRALVGPLRSLKRESRQNSPQAPKRISWEEEEENFSPIAESNPDNFQLPDELLIANEIVAKLKEEVTTAKHDIQATEAKIAKMRSDSQKLRTDRELHQEELFELQRQQGLLKKAMAAADSSKPHGANIEINRSGALEPEIDNAFGEWANHPSFKTRILQWKQQQSEIVSANAMVVSLKHEMARADQESNELDNKLGSVSANIDNLQNEKGFLTAHIHQQELQQSLLAERVKSAAVAAYSRQQRLGHASAAQNRSVASSLSGVTNVSQSRNNSGQNTPTKIVQQVQHYFDDERSMSKPPPVVWPTAATKSNSLHNASNEELEVLMKDHITTLRSIKDELLNRSK